LAFADLCDGRREGPVDARCGECDEGFELSSVSPRALMRTLRAKWRVTLLPHKTK